MGQTYNFLRGRRGAQTTMEERAVLESVLSSAQTFEARTPLVRAGDPVERSILLIDGFMCRYLDDRRGHRQLVALHVPGDFVDLHGFPLQRLDHDVATITRATVAFASHESLTRLTEVYPHLARMLWFSTLLDAAMHREWIFRLGRLNAPGRVAHFLAETDCRLQGIGISDGVRFRLPLTQADLGEACGLTSIHVGRTLTSLRRQGIVEFSDQVVTIHDKPELHRLAEFKPSYLYFDDDILTP